MRKFGLTLAISGVVCSIIQAATSYAEQNDNYRIWCVCALWASTCALLEYKLLKNKL